jgi:hypothetical protein
MISDKHTLRAGNDADFALVQGFMVGKCVQMMRGINPLPIHRIDLV